MGPTQSDLDNLRLLSIFHFVYAAFCAICAMFPLLYMGMGAAFVSGAFNNTGGGAPPPAVGWLFIILGGTLTTIGLIMAAGVVLTGVSLANGRRHLFCVIVAFIECINFPFGTLLGVFTAVTLLKPGVKAYFDSKKPGYHTAPYPSHNRPPETGTY